MQEIKCKNCNGNEWIEKEGILICAFCGSKYRIENDIKKSAITVNNDIELLLQKCKDDPKNAKRYANLILDIDPGNRKAKKILRGW